jgi:hypothetical protein
MRTSNPDHLTAATAEQLLDGGPGPAGLQQLLAAAAGPGTASELAGETAAVAAFVGAPRETSLPSAPTRRPSMLSTALSKILAAKALAAVVLVAGATGGVALAANASSAPSSSDETAATSTATADADNEEGANPDAGSDATAAPAPDATKAPSPEPSILGLCKAWSAGATDNPGKAAENPAFRSLVEAAGSAADVPGFCAVRERTEQPGRSATAPGHADDSDATTGDDAGTTARKGGPPEAAPGNPDHPGGPPAGRATRDGDEADRDNRHAQDGEDGEDRDDADSGGSGDDAKHGGQGGDADRPGRSTS